MRVGIIAIAGLSLCLTAAAAAAGGPGTTGADVLKVALGARPNALGGAYSAVGGDVQAVLFNPAALSTLPGADAVFLHFLSLEEVTYEMLGYGQPVKDLGTLGGTLVWRTMPTIDNPGAADNPVAANDVVATLGLSRKLTELLPGLGAPFNGLAVGAAGKIIYSSLREAHAVDGALDLGVCWSDQVFTRPVTVAAAIQNIGPPLKFIEQADPLPLTVRLGLAVIPYSDSRHRGLITAEETYCTDGQLKTALGAEYALLDTVFFRVGYTLAGQDNLGGPAGGLGVAFSAGGFRARIDYTYRPQLWNGWDSVASNHLLSLGASF
jgi:hypothetical protein